MQLFRVLPVLGNVVLLGWLTLALFHVWMLLDCLGSRMLPVGQKVAWFLAIVFLPVVGSTLYFLLAKGGTGSRPLV